MTEGGHDDRAIREILRETLGQVTGDHPREMIGVGGTVTTLAAMDMRLEVYNRERVHGYVLDASAIRRLLEELAAAGPEGRKSMPGLQPARADIIMAGVRILLAVMEGLGLGRARVSEADLMYGLALEAVKTVETKTTIDYQK